MRRMFLFAICGLFLLIAPPTYADWDPGMPAKWVQLPDLDQTGIDVNASDAPDGFILADDFECTQTGPLTEIHIWGSWLGDLLPQEGPTGVGFILAIYSDIPAAQSPTGYSMPGDPLWEHFIDPGQFGVRPYAEDIAEGWMDPPENYLPPPADTVCWQYNFNIPEGEAFVQQGAPGAPMVYWLSVKAINMDQAAMFGWKTSVDHWNDDAVFGNGGQPHPGPWYELIYPLGHPWAPESIDLAFVVNGPDIPQEDYDFGDAPDPKYPTLLASNGARHLITGLTLGNLIDPEPDGQPNASATGDDVNNQPDEDGVILSNFFVPGQNVSIPITVNGSGMVDAWIDWNADGDWTDPGEQIMASVPITGVYTATITVPNNILGGYQTFARFRLSSSGGLAPDGVYADGTVPDGEVEDYEMVIEKNPDYKWSQAPDLSEEGIDVNASHVPRDYILADDFLCDEPGLINEITVFGSWLGDVLPNNEPNSVVFQLSIHADIPANQNPDGYSMPGEVLWYQEFQPGSFVADIHADGISEGWMDPPDAYQPPPADTVCWRYTFPIDATTAFFQQGTTDNPVVYWLDVKAVPLDDTGPLFGWKTSMWHWNDDAVWGEGMEPYPGPWQELRYPLGHPQEGISIDLAFALRSTPGVFDLDYGDAPDSYQTLLASGGPRHYLGNLVLGGQIDPEPDGQPDPAAMGDDMNGLPDEDGVIWTGAITQGQPFTFQVTASAPGFLSAWIDWGADGTFAEAGDVVLLDLAIPAGPTTYTVTVPASAVPGQTFARFRLSNSTGLTWHGVLPTGQVPNGEVEDHQLVIEQELGWKWIQRPDLDVTGIDVNASPAQRDYILADDFLCTERSAISEIHVWGSWLGDVLPNFEPHNVAFTLSIHSDQPATPGEHSRPLDPLWVRHFAPGEFNVRPYMEEISEGWLDPPDAYIPPPADTKCYEYIFTVPHEEAFIQEGSIGSPVVYWLDLKAFPQGDGTEFFGWKTSLDHWNDDAVWGEGVDPYFGPWFELIYPDGHWFEGQSIDLAFGLLGEPVPYDYDWGDAPDSYGTLWASGGPRHLSSQYILGSLIDTEADGLPQSAADGDDNDNLDDEDGVTFTGSFKPGATVLVDVSAPNGGVLDAWIDWDGNGTFDASETIFSSLPLTAGNNPLNVAVPAAIAENTTSYARFRLSSTGGLGPNGDLPGGTIPDGEVEDYLVHLEDKYVYKWIQHPDLTPDGIDVNATALGGEDHVLADDFLCDISGPLTDIHVWGSWLNDEYPAQGPGEVTFTLSIHADIPADQSPTEYSMPGEVLWIKTFRPGEFETIEFASQIVEGWLDPPDRYQFPADWTCWQYKFHVDPHLAFQQEGTEDRPVVYWLDLQAQVEEQGPMFGWKTTMDHWNDDAVWGYGFEPFTGPWYELIYPQGHELEGFSIDLAFAIYQDLVTPVPEVPEKVGLLFNAPNPFNPATDIHFVMPEGGGKVRLEVFDARGRLVATLVDRTMDGGRQKATWYGTSDGGRMQPSGIYFSRLVLPDGTTETMKMTLLK